MKNYVYVERVEFWVSLVLSWSLFNAYIMKEQCFLVRKDRRGRGVTVLNRDKTEVSRGVGGRGECMKMGHTCLERMSLKCRSIWNAKS